MAKCNWCNTKEGKLETYEMIGGEISLCKKCTDSSENDICRTCGETLGGELPYLGECSGCQQITSAKAEKRKSELLNGLGVDVLAELTHSVVFTEADYERWVTFGQGNFTPEKRKMYRREWIKHKLMKENSWTIEIFNENVKDIEWILENHSNKVFGKTCRFIVGELSSKELRGLRIVASSGNVKVLSDED